MCSGVFHISGSGIITHCIPAAKAALTPFGLSSKTRQVSGFAGGTNLKVKIVRLRDFSGKIRGGIFSKQKQMKKFLFFPRIEFGQRFLFSTRRKKMNFQWEDVTKTTELQIMTCKGCESKPKIAAFDMDGTLITTKSGRVFPLNPQDWKLLYEPQVKQTLQKLHHEDNYKIVIITNQAGIGTGKLSKNDFRSKVESIVNSIQVPLQLFAATQK